MAKLKMKRIEIIALLHDSKAIVELLQRRGVVEVRECESSDACARLSTAQSVAQFDKNQHTVYQALGVLSEFSPQKKSMLDTFAGRKELTLDEYGTLAGNVDILMRQVYDILSLSKRIESDRTAIAHTASAIDALQPWLPLDISMRFKGTAHTTAFIGTLPQTYTTESLSAALKDVCTEEDSPDIDAIEAEIVSSSREQSCVFVLCCKSEEALLEKSLRALGFTRPADPTKHAPQVRMDRHTTEIQRLQEDIATCIEKIKAYATAYGELTFLYDYFSLAKDKYAAIANLAITQRTFVLSGYIPERDAASLTAELEEGFAAYVSVTEPAEDEDVPVLLKNNAFVAPVEDITAAYSMPAKDDIDPNPIMSFFYYLFFGMMLSDAGYGLLMVIATGLILALTKPEEGMKRNMQKFLYCGISTVFWGAMYGSWFGNIVYVVSHNFFGSEFTLAPLWFDPVADPLNMLIFCLILGFIHVVVGLGVKFFTLWRTGHKLDALCDIGTWYVVFLGLVLLILGMTFAPDLPLQSIGMWVALAGAIGLVLTQGRSSPSIPGKIIGGVTSLYSITGYFSDVLSYCRLMALGLVTGIIATVINTIGGIVGGGVFGAIALTVIFVFGHAINLGINALGAYVHCNRLQYVEFFSKFYEGAGKAFAPFRANTTHYKLKEENKNA